MYLSITHEKAAYGQGMEKPLLICLGFVIHCSDPLWMALVQLLLCIIYLYKKLFLLLIQWSTTARENCPIVKKLFRMSNCGCVSHMKVVDETFLLIFLLGASALLSSNMVLSMQVLSVV